MVKGGLRKKVRHVHKNTVPEDHCEDLAYWIKCMQLINFKFPLFMVIQQLFCVAKGGGWLWLEKFKDGVPSIKWDKYFVEDPQWGMTEAKMRPLETMR